MDDSPPLKYDMIIGHDLLIHYGIDPFFEENKQSLPKSWYPKRFDNRLDFD